MPGRRGPDQDSALKRWLMMQAVRSAQRRQHLERDPDSPALRRRWSRNWCILILAGGGLAAWLLEVGADGWQGPAIGVGMIIALGYVINRFGPPV